MSLRCVSYLSFVVCLLCSRSCFVCIVFWVLFYLYCVLGLALYADFRSFEYLVFLTRLLLHIFFFFFS